MSRKDQQQALINFYLNRRRQKNLKKQAEGGDETAIKILREEAEALAKQTQERKARDQKAREEKYQMLRSESDASISQKSQILTRTAEKNIVKEKLIYGDKEYKLKTIAQRDIESSKKQEKQSVRRVKRNTIRIISEINWQDNNRMGRSSTKEMESNVIKLFSALFSQKFDSDKDRYKASEKELHEKRAAAYQDLRNLFWKNEKDKTKLIELIQQECEGKILVRLDEALKDLHRDCEESCKKIESEHQKQQKQLQTQYVQQAEILRLLITLNEKSHIPGSDYKPERTRLKEIKSTGRSATPDQKFLKRIGEALPKTKKLITTVFGTDFKKVQWASPRAARGPSDRRVTPSTSVRHPKESKSWRQKILNCMSWCK